MSTFDNLLGSDDVRIDAETLEQERLRKLREQEMALERTLEYTKEHQWSQDDTDTVLMALGLKESPPPLKTLSRR